MNNVVTIIMYHYVRDLKNSSYPDIKGLDVTLFEGQIEYLLNYYKVITMEEVIEAIYKGKKLPSKAALLTFDDGYIDNYQTVFPILNKYSLQGSFYIPYKTVKENKMLDINKLHFALASVEDKSQIITDIYTLLDEYRTEYTLKETSYYYEKLAQASRFDTAEVIFIKRLLQRELEEELRNIITDKLFKKYVGESEESFSQKLYMNTDQIKQLINSGMHIGGHGYNHYWLENLDEREQRRQINLSLELLEELGVDLSSWTFSYPFGSYNATTIKLLKEKHCKLAITTKVDLACLNICDPFELPRLDTNDLPKEKNAPPTEWYNKYN